ncbi:MAG: UDP-N-acetylglucosamine 2-epimerase (non-hydrolyzing) [Bradymonadia bacterium]
MLASGQHERALAQLSELFDGVPLEHLNVFEPGQSLTTLGSRIIESVGRVIRNDRPRAVIVQGDTITAFGAAMAAFYEHTPVIHVEAGLRTSSIAQPFPEELHRRTISSIATLHLAPTEDAASNLRAEGVPAERIRVTGNTGQDALRLVLDGAPRTPSSDDDIHCVLTIHRRENALRAGDIAEGLKRATERHPIRITAVRHPNREVWAPLEACLLKLGCVEFLDPLPYPNMVRLLSSSSFVLTDSGGLQEEAVALGVPVLVARQETCRPEGISAGGGVVVGTDPEVIAEWMSRIASDSVLRARMSVKSDTYGDGYAAKRCVDAVIELGAEVFA